MDKANQKKILIVEDEKPLLRILKVELERAGFLVLEAKNGEEGLVVALKNHPDLILLDIIMPKMNGIKMLNALREDSWGKAISVLLLTNDANADHIRETLKHNATDYLIKSDWEMVDVIKKVKATLKM